MKQENDFSKIKNNNLIFDLGFFDGTDTKYYIEHGYNVVAVEANPYLFNIGLNMFKKEIEEERLVLLNRAIISEVAKKYSDTIDFFIYHDRPEVSSIFIEIAEQDGNKAEKVTIETTSIVHLIEEFGCPYYCKVDIESADKDVAEDLYVCDYYYRPEYISFEINKNDYYDIFHNMYCCGYKYCQLINQIHNKVNSSGDFGQYLQEEKWLTINEALIRYIKYRELKMIDNVNLGVGWIDAHFRLF